MGFAGQTAGFYQSLFALASVTIAIVVGMSVFILWSARSLDDLDRERERADEERHKIEEAARKSAERFLWLVDGVRDYAMFLIDAQGMIRNDFEYASNTLNFFEGKGLFAELDKMLPPKK